MSGNRYWAPNRKMEAAKKHSVMGAGISAARKRNKAAAHRHLRVDLTDVGEHRAE